MAKRHEFLYFDNYSPLNADVDHLKYKYMRYVFYVIKHNSDYYLMRRDRFIKKIETLSYDGVYILRKAMEEGLEDEIFREFLEFSLEKLRRRHHRGGVIFTNLYIFHEIYYKFARSIGLHYPHLSVDMLYSGYEHNQVWYDMINKVRRRSIKQKDEDAIARVASNMFEVYMIGESKMRELREGFIPIEKHD